jgi:hypothetical protein
MRARMWTGKQLLLLVTTGMSVFLPQFGQWLGDVSESRDEPPVVGIQSKEPP